MPDDDANLKAVGLKDGVSSSVGRGSRVKRMRVAPAQVLPSGDSRRGTQRVSVAQIQPSILPTQASTLPEGPQGPGESAASGSLRSIGAPVSSSQKGEPHWQLLDVISKSSVAPAATDSDVEPRADLVPRTAVTSDAEPVVTLPPLRGVITQLNAYRCHESVQRERQFGPHSGCV